MVVAYTKGEVTEVEGVLPDKALTFTFTGVKEYVWFCETDNLTQGKIMTLKDVIKTSAAKKLYNHELFPADVLKPNSIKCCFVPKEEFPNMVGLVPQISLLIKFIRKIKDF